MFYKGTEIAKAVFLMIFLLIVIVIFNISTPINANEYGLTIDQKIELARQIWVIENSTNLPDSARMPIIRQFARLNDSILSTIAMIKLLNLYPDSVNAVLSGIDNEQAEVTKNISTILINNTSPDSIISLILSLKNADSRTPISVIGYIDLELASIITYRGWTNYAPEELWHIPEIQFAKFKDRIENLPRSRKIQVLDSLLTGWEMPSDYEAAIRALSEDMGNEEIPSILNKLQAPQNIPKSNPPPWERAHTNFHVLLLMIKCNPDERSIPMLRELAANSNEYISNMAADALQWVTSGVAYPIEYRGFIW